MDTRELLYRILFRALIEMREEAYTIQNKRIFFIADLLHTLPLDLMRDLPAGATFDDLLESLKSHAQAKGGDKWLSEAIIEETRYQ